MKSMKILALMAKITHKSHQNCEEFTSLAKVTEDKCLGLKARISCSSLQFLWLGCLHWNMGFMEFCDVDFSASLAKTRIQITIKL